MALNIRDKEVDRLAGELARARHTTKTQAVKLALRHELIRTLGLKEHLRPLQDRLQALPDSGPADKAFFDDLSGEP